MPRPLRDVAEELAVAHRTADNQTSVVKLFPSLQQDEIHLLEVSASVPTTGEVLPFRFGADVAHGVDYPSVVILLSPEEWQGVERSPSAAGGMEPEFSGGSIMPVTPRDWADPFLEQAREDLKAAWRVLPDESASTLCMLIQMVFEKLAKAAYARSGGANINSHQAASRLFGILKRHPAGTSLLTASPQVEQFVKDLENAHPAIAGRQNPPWPQLEYPWEDTTTGTVLYPAKNLYLARRVRDPKDRIAIECLKFASALEKQLTTIVP